MKNIIRANGHGTSNAKIRVHQIAIASPPPRYLNFCTPSVFTKVWGSIIGLRWRVTPLRDGERSRERGRVRGVIQALSFMRVLHPGRLQLRSLNRSQVDDVSLPCFPSSLPEEEDYRGDDHEQGDTPNNAPSNGSDVTPRSTLGAFLITALICWIRCSWWGAGSRGDGSNFRVPPDRFCERGVEVVLFRVIEVGPMRYRSILWDAGRVLSHINAITELRPPRPRPGASRILAKCAGGIQTKDDRITATFLAYRGIPLRVCIDVPWFQWPEFEVVLSYTRALERRRDLARVLTLRVVRPSPIRLTDSVGRPDGRRKA